jgi:hypothetical protein
MSYLIRLLVWISPKYSSNGLPVWTPLITNQERPRIYKQLDEALSLLKARAPGRYERVRQSLKGFLIFGIDSTNASYHPTTGVCQLREKFILAPDNAVAVNCPSIQDSIRRTALLSALPIICAHSVCLYGSYGPLFGFAANAPQKWPPNGSSDHRSNAAKQPFAMGRVDRGHPARWTEASR